MGVDGQGRGRVRVRAVLIDCIGGAALTKDVMRVDVYVAFCAIAFQPPTLHVHC